MPNRLRALFEELVDLRPEERAARIQRLDRDDPDLAALERLFDADDQVSGRLAGLDFLRAPAASEHAGSSFDAAAAFAPNYTIERELEGGGMSRVFLGRDAKLGRQIVAKVLPPELAAEVSLERFQYEIRIAAQLRHPHIVPLLESGEAGGCLYYTMPFIEGESLRDRLKREGLLPVSTALRFAIEIAEALAHAHGLGVIHRDIKPGNVLIDSGHAVVADFGIARALSDAGTATRTRSGVVIGTPSYMSPEQASANGSVDARTDIYSLGCVLHEMLCGPPRFGGSAGLATGPRARGLRVPARVRAIIARATAQRSVDRFQSAEAMREALLAEVAPRITPRIMWSAVAGLVVLGIAAGVVLRPRRDYSFASPDAVVRQVTMRGDVRLAAISPGGNYFAFVTGDTILHVGEVGTAAQATIRTGLRFPPHPWMIRQISWSPAGEALYYWPDPPYEVSAVSKLGTWRMVITNPRLAGPVNDVWSSIRGAPGVAVSPADSSLVLWLMPAGYRDAAGRVFNWESSAILHVPARGSARVDTIPVRLDMFWAMISISPNGRWIAACGGSRSGFHSWRVALIAVDGTTQTMLDSSDIIQNSCGVMWSPRGDTLHVWPKTPGTGLLSYGIDDRIGKPLGPPVPFPLPRGPDAERTSFTLSADGRRLAYVQHSHRRSVAVAELGASVEVLSQDANVGARDPTRPEISPVGDQFAYVIADDSGSAIYTQDVHGGEPRRLSRNYREGISGARWSDDAKRLATLTRRDSQPVILILDATGAELMTLRMRHAIYDTTVLRPAFDWAAHSSGIMYFGIDSARRSLDTWFIDLATGQEKLLLSSLAANSTLESLPVWSPDGKSFVSDSNLHVNIRDAATGTKHDVNALGVPLVWRADGTFFVERINADSSISIWRSSLNKPPSLYAHFGRECKLVSIDRQARRAVCQVYHDESDVFVATRP